ncbi:MAG: hypothetical protein AAFQ94_00300 [Bacteroidota bacterium]
MIDKRLAFVLLMLFGVALYGILEIEKDLSPGYSEKFKLEVLKYLLQLIVVIIIGGIIASLFKLQEYDRNVTQLKGKVYESYISRIGGLYRQVKGARRILRSNGLSSINRDPHFKFSEHEYAIYSEQMKLLNEVQLQLEGLMIESQHLPIIKGYQIDFDLHLMEDYLRRIHAEFEAASTPKEFDYSFHELRRLDEFTCDTRTENFSFEGEIAHVEDNPKEYKKTLEYRFMDTFWKPYDSVISRISELLPK